MLGLLRRKAQSPFIQATVVIIALVFIFWGVGSQRGGSGTPVAEVNDEPILYQDYQRAYDRVVSQYREQFGGAVPTALLKQLKLEGQVVNQLINGVLLRQGAARMGLIVSNTEVKQAVQEMEAFRNNGVFDLARYEAILSSSRMTPAGFESSKRTDLLTNKVMDYLGRLAKVTPAEINDRVAFEKEELQLEYVAFAATDFTAPFEEVSDADLLAFYEQHLDSYQTEPQIKLKYMAFLFDEDIAAMEIDDDQVRQYYEENFSNYSEPERRAARHILIKTSPDDSIETLTSKKARAENVLQMARRGDDFVDLATRLSEGPSAAQGGSLGSVTRGRMVQPFDDALFSLAEGEISDVVQTKFGFHVIKLETIEPARTRELDEVRDEIVTVLKQQQAKGLTFARASKAYEGIVLAGSLEKYEAESDASVQETPFFARNNPPGSGRDLTREPAFLTAAFALKKGELGSLIETNQGYAIIYAADYKDPEIAAMEEVKAEVKKDYISDSAKTAARQAAEQLLATVRQTGSDRQGWVDALEAIQKSPQESGFVTRSGIAQNNGAALPAPVIQQGFNLSPRHPYPAEAVVNGRTFYVVRYIERRPPTPEVLETARNEFRARLLEDKKADMLNAWLAKLKSEAEISINEQYM